jgi:hypothetical protein
MRLVVASLLEVVGDGVLEGSGEDPTPICAFVVHDAGKNEVDVEGLEHSLAQTLVGWVMRRHVGQRVGHVFRP